MLIGSADELKNQVVVVTPVYRLPLTAEEEIAIVHLLRYLHGSELTLLAPHSLKINHPLLRHLPVERFDDTFFTGTAGYNKLMLSPHFYQRYSTFEYLLIYQLDCLVFSSALVNWCDRGWDYVGAPWFRGFRDDTSEGLWRTGNGGFSLRRVAKFLEVLASRRPGTLPEEWRETRFLQGRPHLQEHFYRVKQWAYRHGYKNTVKYLRRAYELNEDGFWSMEAARFVDEFVVAPPDEALGFAFEYAPRVCYEMNGRTLPFGCHAWNKIDPEFWRPMLLDPASQRVCIDGAA